jgi:DDE family transposase
MENIGGEDWRVLLGLFPENWQEEAERCGALERLRGFRSAEALIRTILLHVGRGYSLRETVVQARAGEVANVSGVAFMKRLRKSEAWLRSLCLELLRENGVTLAAESGGRVVRIVDATIVKEPGKTGSQWRLMYSLQLPSLLCDFFDLTSARGSGTGEVLSRFPVRRGDLLLGDAAYCSASGIVHVISNGGDVLVRANPQNLAIFTKTAQKRMDLLKHLRKLRKPGEIGDWPGVIRPLNKEGQPIEGRVCALRKSETEIRRAERKLRRKASKTQVELQPETFEYAKYVIVFTTWQKASADQILTWYRVRWQIELAFKRLKSLARLGHLPKYDDASSRAWLYGKLFVALLAQKLMRIGRDVSPWGYELFSNPQ